MLGAVVGWGMVRDEKKYQPKPRPEDIGVWTTPTGTSAGVNRAIGTIALGSLAHFRRGSLAGSGARLGLGQSAVRHAGARGAVGRRGAEGIL